jgi:nicotinamidase/pyrazinamidase
MKKLLLVVDAQNDFMKVDGLLTICGAAPVIDHINDVLKNADPEEYIEALFTFDTHIREDYVVSEEAKMFQLHCELGTTGHDLAVNAENLHPDIPVRSLNKGVFDMWVKDKLFVKKAEDSILKRPMGREEYFSNLKGQGIQTVTVVGVASDYCVMYAVNGLIERGFNVEIVAKATKGINKEIDEVVAENWPGKVTLV